MFEYSYTAADLTQEVQRVAERVRPDQALGLLPIETHRFAVCSARLQEWPDSSGVCEGTGSPARGGGEE